MTDESEGQAPVVVIGAGPAGLTVANLLATLDIPVIVLERNAATVNQPRAIILDDEGMRVMQAIGLHQSLLDDILPSDGAAYYDDDWTPFIETGVGIETYGFAKRYFIDQPDLEHALAKGLKRFPHASLHFNTEVREVAQSDGKVRLSLADGTSISTDWLLACDGARSGVRDQLGIEMEGFAYPDRWLVIDTSNDPDTERRAKFVCRQDRPFVSIPAPRGGRRYEFKIFHDEMTDGIPPFEQVHALLAPMRDLARSDLRRAAIYGFRASVANRWQSDRILLMGDAAHLTPPFAGQGMNAGLRDAINVAWKIALHRRGIASPRLLDSYEAERREAATNMIQLAVTMGEIIMPASELDRTLRAALMSKLAAFPEVRRYFMEMRFKPLPRIKDESFVGVMSPSVPASLVGSAIPQPFVTQGSERHRLDDLLGFGFAVLMQSREIATWAAAQPAAFWRGLNPTLLLLEREEGAAIEGVTTAGGLADPIAFPLLAHRDHAILIRPDRYVAALFTPDIAASTLDEFMRLLEQEAA